MLLEAYQLLANRVGQGHSDNQSHEHFSTNMSKAYNTWRLILNLDGSVHGIELMDGSEVPGFWSLVEGTSATAKRFPALRYKSPLLILDAEDDAWNVLKKISESNLGDVKGLLLKLAAELPKGSIDFMDSWQFKAMSILDWNSVEEADLLDRLKHCVSAFGRFCGLAETQGWEYPVQAKLGSREWRIETGAKRIEQANEIGNRVITVLIDVLKNTAQVQVVKAIVATLLGTRKEKNGKGVIKISAQLCIDIHLPDSLGSTIYTARMAKMVLGCLGATTSNTEPQGVCAISGAKGPLLKTKLPDWDAPLFKTPPYSKFSAAPCNQRYGRFGLDGFDISSQLARSLVGGLQKMTDPGLEWKTWAKLHNGKFKKQSGKKPIPLQDLMLVYPSFDVAELVTIDVFVQPQIEDAVGVEEQARQFLDCSERLCRGLKEKLDIESSATEYMRIMLVEKVSQGQIQLSYAAMPTVKEFISALGIWTQSAKNLPTGLRVPLPYKKSATEFRWRTPRLLFPEQIGRLLSQHWTHDGSESTAVQGPTLGMVFDLFLQKEGVWKEATLRLLEMTLLHSDALLIGAGHALHRDGFSSFDQWTKFIAKAQSGKVKRQPDYALTQTISLLGSLLYIMNSTVQNYTNESAYLIGKLLAMMDELHRCYCVVERKGDIPNSLIGNSLLGRAADSPAMALADLSERGRIYLGWAKSAVVRDGIDKDHQIAVTSARKLLRLAQPIADQLHASADLDMELPAIRKAHLFLGYLSPTLGKDESLGNVAGSAPLAIPVAAKIEDALTKDAK